MANFRREKITLDRAADILRFRWAEGSEPHITFDPDMRSADCQYQIIRQHSHDGTLMFTQQIILEAFRPLLLMESYYKPMGNCPDGFIPHYTIGLAKMVTVMGTVDLPAGRYPGQRERISIPVRCEYVRRCK